MGPVEAITATAHKMARTIYYMILKKTDFQDSGGDYYDKLNQEKTLKFLTKRAKLLGYTLEKTENISTLKSVTCEEVT